MTMSRQTSQSSTTRLPLSIDGVHLLAVAVEAAKRVGRFQVEERNSITSDDVSFKANAYDFVSSVDKTSEKLLKELLIGATPADGFIGEEYGAIPGSSDRRWVVDPLDGTRYYLRKNGPHCISIAYGDEQQTYLAVVHDPVADETFTASLGAGAELNGRPISPSSVTTFESAVFGIGISPTPEQRPDTVALFTKLIEQVGDFRRLPGALQLAYVASGRLDCGLILHAEQWDVAAGLLLVTEAGGWIGGICGEPPSGSFAASACPGMSEAWARLTAS